MQLYRLFWEDFSSFYLEIIKPEFGKAIDKITYRSTIDIFENLLKLLHPFMPFITEEIWHLIKERAELESIMGTEMPGSMTYGHSKTYDPDMLSLFDDAKEVIGFIRNTRANNQIPNKEKLELSINAKGYHDNFNSVIQKLGNLSSITMIDHKPEGVVSLITKSAEYYVSIGDSMNHQEEIKKIEAELNYIRGFLDSVMKKLNNTRFISNAPANIIENETKKKADAESKLKALEERLKILKK